MDLPFDFEKYENSDDETRCKYYIELVRQGLELASKVKKIPYDEMMEFLHHLAENNFTYTWDFKNVIDWENNLKVKFVAELGTNDFILKAQVFTRRPKELICQGQVARTKPDQIHFSLLSKYIRLEDGRINFYCNSQQILFLEVKELIAGKVIVHFNREDGFAQFAEGVLTYDNYDFR